jgi:hypothetical protein
MPPLAKHAGTPDACLTCRLADSPRERNEVIWEHALAQFADQSGVDVAAHTRADLELFVKAWSRSAAVVQMDAALHTETSTRPNSFRFEPTRGPHPSAYAMGVILAAISLIFIIICSGIWRFFT